MATFQSFEEIEAWKESRLLIKSVRAICKRNDVKNDWAFIDQITRSARSIAANIAEGCDALTPPEFITYLGHAKRSAAETRSHLYDAVDEKYVTEKEFAQLSEQTKKICSMLAKLIHYLQSLDQREKRTMKSHAVQRITKNEQTKNGSLAQNLSFPQNRRGA